MTDAHESDELIRETLAPSWSSGGLRETLQIIADGVCTLAGFGAAAISVIRDSREFEVIAVAGGDADLRKLVGTFSDADHFYLELARGIDWGGIVFVPPERQSDLHKSRWQPTSVYPDLPDAWDAANALLAPLHDERGQLIAMLQVDDPLDGRMPDQTTRDLLNRYTTHARDVVARALEHDRLAEQVRLARTARAIVRSASTRLDVPGVLRESQQALLDGFGIEGMWVHLFAPSSYSAVMRPGIAPMPASFPADLVDVIELAAEECWRRRRVGVLSRARASQGIVSEEIRERALESLNRQGYASAMFVPLGAGQHALGCLLMARRTGDGEWSDPEVEVALDIGHDLGLALMNARLYKQDLELMERLSELDTYKSHLIAAIVHELKSPITVISGNLERIEDAGGDAPEILDATAAMRRGTTRLNSLVTNLLHLGRADGRPERPPGVVTDVGDVVDDVLAMLAAQAHHRDIEVSTVLPGLPTMAACDAESLHMILMNLIGNAIKYNRDSGWVRVEVGQSGDEVRIQIADGGLGIRPEDQEHLFEEFFRSSEVAARVPGTGLGLTIVARLLENLDGRIGVESTPGRGSTFTVVLPAG